MAIEATRGHVWCQYPRRCEPTPQDLEHCRIAKIKGITPLQCGKPGEIAIDNACYCRAHAGERLLQEALDGIS